MRLGLLSDPKYCAVVNNYSDAAKFSAELEAGGAVDLLALARERRRRHELRLPPDLPQPRRPSAAAPLSAHSEEDDQAAEIWATERADRAEQRGPEAMEDFVPPSALTPEAAERLQPDERTQLGEVASLLNHESDVNVVRETVGTLDTSLRVYGFPRGDIGLFPPSPVGSESSLGWYLMDAASLLPVLALDLKLGDEVLDLCAAPGGKSLLILQTMLPSRLVCNDNQVGRLNRLRNTLMSFIPPSAAAAQSSGGETSRLLRDRISLSRTDATLPHWAREQGHAGAFDKVLVDAPCTTDRHALSVDSERGDTGSIFRRSRSAERLRLPELQTRLLLTAFACVRVGGTVVYSTCTLSPLQNDAVVEGAVRGAAERLGMAFEVRDLAWMREDLGRASLFRFHADSRLGSLVLPFAPINFGPMFISKLVRTK